MTESEVRAALAAIGFSGAGSIALDESLDRHGVDSMARLGLFLTLEEHTGKQVPAGNVGQLVSIRAIVDYCNTGQT